MLRIGITGGIGAGKTFVSKRLEAMGFPIFDSDKVAKQLMNNNPEIRIKLTEWIGEECYNENGLNRAFVAQKMFNNAELKQQIEQLVHPKVAQAFDKWAEEQESNLVFIESAILYESGFDQYVDKVLMVDADTETRIKRTMQRDICSREQAEQRVNAQMDQAEKRKRADFVLENNPYSDVNAQLFKLVKSLYILE
jgi:dephospho-CoA kinase